MRPVRSLLFVPANKPDWVRSSVSSYHADGFIFDLEDSVNPEAKPEAREVLREELDEFIGSDRLIAARVNAPESGWFDEDLDAVARAGLDAVLLPKVARVEEIQRLDHLLTHLEKKRSVADSIKVIVFPETARGIRSVYELAGASDRVRAVVGGTTRGADVNRSMGFKWTPGGRERQYMLSKIALDGRAAGLDQILAGVWSDIEDLEGLRNEAEFVRQLGYTGYVVIHPDHLDVVNEIFVPDSDEVHECQQILRQVSADASYQGKGVMKIDGAMVDQAHIQYARNVIERAEYFDLI